MDFKESNSQVLTLNCHWLKNCWTSLLSIENISKALDCQAGEGPPAPPQSHGVGRAAHTLSLSAALNPIVHVTKDAKPDLKVTPHKQV